jgi:hypothetical protein
MAGYLEDYGVGAPQSEEDKLRSYLAAQKESGAIPPNPPNPGGMGMPMQGPALAPGTPGAGALDPTVAATIGQQRQMLSQMGMLPPDRQVYTPTPEQEQTMHDQMRRQYLRNAALALSHHTDQTIDPTTMRDQRVALEQKKLDANWMAGVESAKALREAAGDDYTAFMMYLADPKSPKIDFLTFKQRLKESERGPDKYEQLLSAIGMTPGTPEAQQYIKRIEEQRAQSSGGAEKNFAPIPFYNPETERWEMHTYSNKPGTQPVVQVMPEGVRPQGMAATPGQVSPIIEKAMDAANNAQIQLTRLDTTLGDIDKISDDDWNSGIVGGWKEDLKKRFGGQDPVSWARAQAMQTRNLLQMEQLPPGAASEKDVELVMAPAPPDNANKETWRAYIAANQRVQRAIADYHGFKAKYLNDNPYTMMSGFYDAYAARKARPPLENFNKP